MNKCKVISFGALLVLGMVLGSVLASKVSTTNSPMVIEWLESPREVQSFTLQSSLGAFTKESLKGQWTIVLFGYLHCTDVCPVSLVELARLANMFSGGIVTPDFNVVFVSVDSERDSVQEVTEFVKFFHPSFIGVTGVEAELKRLSQSLGVQFSVTSDKENYVVAHSSYFSIIGPHGKLRGRFRSGADLAQLKLSLMSKMLVGNGEDTLR